MTIRPGSRRNNRSALARRVGGRRGPVAVALAIISALVLVSSALAAGRERAHRTGDSAPRSGPASPSATSDTSGTLVAGPGSAGAVATPVGQLTLAVKPVSPAAGRPFVVEVHGLPRGLAVYQWIVDGLVMRGRANRVNHRRLELNSPGQHVVAVHITIGALTASAQVRFLVRSSPIQPGARDQVRIRSDRRVLSQLASRHPQRADAASVGRDPGVTILDFKFSPGTTTVHVGDTITWTNSGQAPHSATANNHSFDTGILQHGKSASHTFTQAGTFAYFCVVHPYMHGTIVVLASSASTKPSSSSTASTAQSSGTTTAQSSGTTTTAQSQPASGSTLPMTGLDLTGAFLVGVTLLGSGVGLRRSVRRG